MPPRCYKEIQAALGTRSFECSRRGIGFVETTLFLSNRPRVFTRKLPRIASSQYATPLLVRLCHRSARLITMMQRHLHVSTSFTSLDCFRWKPFIVSWIKSCSSKHINIVWMTDRTMLQLTIEKCVMTADIRNVCKSWARVLHCLL